jgi:ElaB/YqjD/DUF883 family membrane-anchored ribosome-binding protein
MATTDLSNDVAKLRSDLDEIRGDLAAIARSIKDLGAATGQEAFQRAEHFGEEARKRAAAAEERIGHEINEHPLASVLTALGVGFAIGKLLDPGRRRP